MTTEILEFPKPPHVPQPLDEIEAHARRIGAWVHYCPVWESRLFIRQGEACFACQEAEHADQ